MLPTARNGVAMGGVVSLYDLIAVVSLHCELSLMTDIVASGKTSGSYGATARKMRKIAEWPPYYEAHFTW